MKIYTKTGDKGQTALFGGQRVAKNNARIEAYGTVDELNSFVGLLRDHIEEEAIRDTLFVVQNRLFNLGAYLATPPDTPNTSGVPDLEEEDIAALEQEMDRMDQSLAPLRNFILPGGHVIVSYAHIARTVCRRAERQVVSMHQQEDIHPIAIQYLNRLSDYCFMLARYLAKTLNAEEITWQKR